MEFLSYICDRFLSTNLIDMNDDMRELNEKELLNVSGGLLAGYADATFQSYDLDKCTSVKKKKDCEKQPVCAWSETSQCQKK